MNGKLQAARAYQEQGIALLSGGSHKLHLEQAFSNYGNILSQLGEIEQADIQLRESYAIGYELRDRSSYALMFFDASSKPGPVPSRPGWSVLRNMAAISVAWPAFNVAEVPGTGKFDS